MHEQSIISYLLSEAVSSAKDKNAGKIISIRLVVGEVTGVEKDAVLFYFQFLAENTMEEGALLDKHHVLVRVRQSQPDHKDNRAPQG